MTCSNSLDGTKSEGDDADIDIDLFYFEKTSLQRRFCACTKLFHASNGDVEVAEHIPNSLAMGLKVLECGGNKDGAQHDG